MSCLKKRQIKSICLLFFLFLTSSLYAQITLTAQNQKIRQILKTVEKTSSYKFFYNTDLTNLDRVVSLSVTDATIETVMDKLLSGTDIAYKKEKENLIVLTVKGLEQKGLVNSKKISGKVLDDNGEAVIGANIVGKGTINGTITEADGSFTLTVPGNAALLVSYIGYLNQQVKVGSQPFLNIVLKEDTQALDEVVVVGYGVQKKVNLTGSVAAVDTKSLANRPVSNVSNAIQGLLPGVTVISGSGQPGKDNTTIRVRGVGTINNSNPMYVVDGMPVSSINDVDPNDIENLSVLKDASSAAIYGSRAANGVILITTKKGTNKAPTLKYDGYVGWQSATALPEYLHSWEYADLYNKALVNEKKKPMFSNEEIEKFRNGSDLDNYPDTDWLGLFYKNGLQQSHRAEISGGTDKATTCFRPDIWDKMVLSILRIIKGIR